MQDNYNVLCAGHYRVARLEASQASSPSDFSAASTCLEELLPYRQPVSQRETCTYSLRCELVIAELFGELMAWSL